MAAALGTGAGLIRVRYRPMFGRSSDMGPFYSAAARCVLNGESLLSCLPQYPYQAALAVFFIPLAYLPPVLVQSRSRHNQNDPVTPRLQPRQTKT